MEYLGWVQGRLLLIQYPSQGRQFPKEKVGVFPRRLIVVAKEDPIVEVGTDSDALLTGPLEDWFGQFREEPGDLGKAKRGRPKLISVTIPTEAQEPSGGFVDEYV